MPKTYKMTEETRNRIRNYQREYHRNYRLQNPEKVKQYKIATAVHLLNQDNQLVIPMPPSPPWHSGEEFEIIQSVLFAMEDIDPTPEVGHALHNAIHMVDEVREHKRTNPDEDLTIGTYGIKYVPIPGIGYYEETYPIPTKGDELA